MTSFVEFEKRVGSLDLLQKIVGILFFVPTQLSILTTTYAISAYHH
jgi:hypothetical protein